MADRALGPPDLAHSGRRARARARRPRCLPRGTGGRPPGDQPQRGAVPRPDPVLEVAARDRPLPGQRQGRAAREHDQPFLAADLLVVGPGLLARRELVDTAAQIFRAEPAADGGDAMPVAVALVLVVPVDLAAEVEDLHPL